MDGFDRRKKWNRNLNNRNLSWIHFFWEAICRFLSRTNFEFFCLQFVTTWKRFKLRFCATHWVKSTKISFFIPVTVNEEKFDFRWNLRFLWHEQWRSNRFGTFILLFYQSGESISVRMLTCFQKERENVCFHVVFRRTMFYRQKMICHHTSCSLWTTSFDESLKISFRWFDQVSKSSVFLQTLNMSRFQYSFDMNNLFSRENLRVQQTEKYRSNFSNLDASSSDRRETII